MHSKTKNFIVRLRQIHTWLIHGVHMFLINLKIKKLHVSPQANLEQAEATFKTFITTFIIFLMLMDKALVRQMNVLFYARSSNE